MLYLIEHRQVTSSRLARAAMHLIGHDMYTAEMTTLMGDASAPATILQQSA